MSLLLSLQLLLKTSLFANSHGIWLMSTGDEAASLLHVVVEVGNVLHEVVWLMRVGVAVRVGVPWCFE